MKIEDIRRIESPDAVMKFEALENRIERMDAVTSRDYDWKTRFDA